MSDRVAPTANNPKVAAGFARLVEGLCDLGEGRVAAMYEAGVDTYLSQSSNTDASRTIKPTMLNSNDTTIPFCRIYRPR